MADDRSRVPALERAARLLEAVAATRPAPGVSELARQLGMPKSSVHNLCASLVDERMLLRGVDGTFRLGPRVYELGSLAAHGEQSGPLIGISVQNDDNPFFAAEIAAAAEEAQRAGARLVSAQAARDSRVQAHQIREFVDAGARLVLADPVDSQALVDAADYARSQGTTIVAINGAATNFDGAVTTDNTRAGILAGEYLARRFPAGARIAVIDGTPVTAIADRIDGLRRALSERGGFEIVAHAVGDNSSTQGYRLATDILTRHPDIDAFFTINDPTASGVSRACREAGASAPIIGVDGSSAAVGEILDGGPIVATATQDPAALGRTGVSFGLQLLGGARPRHRTVLLPTRLITASDATDYAPW
ncbi:substrate-binding domain-containing protein [Microbacterium aurantiacum]|uniref:Substrate-binding domain-containing protein n=1 Tax=Microbacterium aurantiacum TaxID=162393 RepID=A0AAJ2HJP8_9MICO|nr:substrate-binding domain-containing protein [Microbacterium aurantiacum]MDS0245283.1 substrate-binding domain-containing protein [Microbacterium aurantiacum]